MDIVTIRCYGKEEKMERVKAIHEYKMAADCSDGCEKMRYMEILMDLYDGKDFCYDKEE